MHKTSRVHDFCMNALEMRVPSQEATNSPRALGKDHSGALYANLGPFAINKILP